MSKQRQISAREKAKKQEEERGPGERSEATSSARLGRDLFAV